MNKYELTPMLETIGHSRLELRENIAAVRLELRLLPTFRDVVRICHNEAHLVARSRQNPVLFGWLKSDDRRHN